MAIDERNFRSAYYEKVGFKSVEERRSLEILLKEKPLDLSKLKQFCLRFGVPAAHRSLVWKLLLGILPLQEKCHEFVNAQRKEEFSNLMHAFHVLTPNMGLPTSEVLVGMWMLQTGSLRFGNRSEHRGLLTVIQSMMFHFDYEVDVYFLSKSFFEAAQKFRCEVPKLTEVSQTLLEKEDAKLHKHLCKVEVLDTLPLERIWDKVVGGSYKILVYTLVTILTSLKHKLMRCHNLESIVDNVKNISEELSEVIVTKSLELWQQQGSPLTVHDKPKP